MLIDWELPLQERDHQIETKKAQLSTDFTGNVITKGSAERYDVNSNKLGRSSIINIRKAEI